MIERLREGPEAAQQALGASDVALAVGAHGRAVAGATRLSGLCLGEGGLDPPNIAAQQ